MRSSGMNAGPEPDGSRTGPNRLLVVAVVPFYLAWTAVRGAVSRSSAAMAAAARALGRLVDAIVAAVRLAARGVGRLLTPLARLLSSVSRLLEWLS